MLVVMVMGPVRFVVMVMVVGVSGNHLDRGWAEHVETARRVVSGRHPLGRPPGDLADVVAWMALAAIVSAPLVLLFGLGIVSFFIAAAIVGLWVIYRVARGWLALRDGRPIGSP